DKETSRELINEYIQTYKKDVFIRVNNVNSDDFIKDMHFINKISNAEYLKGVMLPQVNSKEDINILKIHLNKFESKLKKKEKRKNRHNIKKDMHFNNKKKNAECLKRVMLPQVNSK